MGYSKLLKKYTEIVDDLELDRKFYFKDNTFYTMAPAWEPSFYIWFLYEDYPLVVLKRGDL